MEMQQLRYVVAVARTKIFSRAAEQCHVAQPSLSQQIQKLEDKFGERLFDRLKREARLTSHGEVFLPRAVPAPRCHWRVHGKTSWCGCRRAGTTTAQLIK